MPPAIETQRLTKIYRQRRRPPVTALQDLDLGVDRGVVFGFLGANGAGKTTTLKLLLRLCYPTRGEAWLLGYNYRDPRVKARLGYMPERPQFYDFLTPRELLRLYATLYRLRGSAREAAVERALGFARLPHAADRRLATLSRGTLQRVGLAQAVLADPDLIFLDEPTSGLDPAVRRELLDLILDLRAQGKTVFLNSHQLAEVEQVCDRVGILHQGRLVAEGALQDLLATGSYQVVARGVTVPTATVLRILGAELAEKDGLQVITLPLESTLWPALEALREGKARLVSVGEKRLSLEEYFLGLEREP
jgi:ABC-2 type transport system ATP-binding protein